MKTKLSILFLSICFVDAALAMPIIYPLPPRRPAEFSQPKQKHQLPPIDIGKVKPKNNNSKSH